MEDAKTAVLYIDHWSSQCSHCGGNADPDEDRHIHGGPKDMYSSDSHLNATNGCGAKFVEKRKMTL